MPRFARKAFGFIAVLFPFAVFGITFINVVPKEKLRVKPTFPELLIFLVIFLASMFVLLLVFSVVWAFVMRIIYGAPTVRGWLSEDLQGRPGVGIEKLFRNACFLVL